MMKINDYVTRKKYGNDMIFKITYMDGNLCYLKGMNYRLYADALVSDLNKVTYQDVDSYDFIDQLEHEVLRGKVLHIDGDKDYLNKCMNFYKEHDTPAVGCYLSENEVHEKIQDLLNKHHPDILVITGHDSYSEKRKEKNLDGYANSKYFIEAVKKARDYQPNKDALIIIAGACQSHYEGLILSGANFASSPTKQNIHALDPASIAVSVANTNVSEYVQVNHVLSMTKSKGLGGIDSKGVARKIYNATKK